MVYTSPPYSPTGKTYNLNLDIFFFWSCFVTEFIWTQPINGDSQVGSKIKIKINVTVMKLILLAILKSRIKSTNVKLNSGDKFNLIS